MSWFRAGGGGQAGGRAGSHGQENILKHFEKQQVTFISFHLSLEQFFFCLQLCNETTELVIFLKKSI